MAPASPRPLRSPRQLRSPRGGPAGMKKSISLSDLLDDADQRQPDSLDESRNQLATEAASLLTEATDASDREKFDLAERAANDALLAFRELGDKSGAAASLRVIIGAYQGRNDVDLAFARAQEELERCQENGNRLGEAAMTMSLAELKLDTQLNRKKEAVNMAKKALSIVQEAKDRRLEAAGFLTLSMAYEQPNKAEHMARAARAALEAHRRLGDRRGEVKALHLLAVAYSLGNDLQEALKISKQARELCRELGMTVAEAAELQAMADYNRSLKDYGQMLKDAEEAMNLCRQMGQLQGEATALRYLVKAYTMNNLEEKGLEVAEECLRKFRSQNFDRGEAMAQDQIASILFGLRRLSEALEAALDALEIVKKLDDPSWEAVMLHSVAALHVAMKNHEQGLKVAQEAIWILEQVGDRTGQAYVRLNTVLQAQTALNEHQEALATAEECVTMFRELKDRKGEATALLMAANVYKTVGYLEEAEKWLAEAQQIFEDIGERRLLAQVLHSLAKVHIAKNEPAEAVRLGYEAHALCKRARDKAAEAGTLLFTVEAHLSLIAQLVEQGRPRGSRELQEQLSKAEKAGLAAKKIAEKLSNIQTLADCLYAISEVRLVSGQYQEALAGADEGIQMYRECGYPLGECTFVNMKAQALLVSGKIEEALVAANDAVRMAKDLDDKPLETLAQEILEHVTRSQGGGAAVSQAQPQFVPEQPAQQQEALAPEPEAASAVVEEKPKGLEAALVSDMLHNLLREMIGSAMESDTPFMDAGVDSLMSIEFRSQVNAAFQGLSLSSTLTFDYPTIRELTSHIVDKSKNQ
eukprot:TRINITY_DN103990_c0_g1_i1.p1 TRINITY_DN103990_c0_g1~~TRINITY_DN103990_c0_g1_i1.p1  ORF type:complete len:821 (+),score=219.93 TRINITY_DN103990_c0_g1_i1:30-2465(+)